MLYISDKDRLVTETTSIGNQVKFYNKEYWIKLDKENQYEWLAEHFVTLLERRILGLNYVSYDIDKVLYKDNEYCGCYCKNMFITNDLSFISLKILFKTNNISYNILFKYDKIIDNIFNVIDTVYSLTKLNLLNYFNNCLLLDCLILNEDRHIMNLGVFYDNVKNKFLEAPIFDNGSSLFCTDWTYRKNKSFIDNIKSSQSVARPFSKFFDKQVEAILYFSQKPLLIKKEKIMNVIYNFNTNLYRKEQTDLVKQVILYNLERYENKLFIYV